MRLRRWKKWLRRLLLCVLTLALLAAAALFIPWSPPFLRAYLEGVIAARLDCRVSIERATLYLWQGRLCIEHLRLDYSDFADRFQPCGIPQLVWNVDHARVAVNWHDVLSQRRPAAVTVSLRDLDAVVVAFVQNTPVCFPPIPDWVRTQPKAQSPQPRISLQIENAVLRVRDPVQVSSERADFLLPQINCLVTLDPQPPISEATLSGRIGQSQLSSFQIALTASPRGYNVRLRTTPIRFGDPGIGPPSLSGRTDSLRLDVQIGRDPTDQWSGLLVANCPLIEALGVTETATSLTLTGAYDPRTSCGKVALSLASRDSRIRAGAAFHPNGDRNSTATITVERLADAWLRLYNARRPPQWPAIEGHPKHLAVEAAARITASPPRLREPRVRVAFAGPSLSSDYLPFPVTDIDFEGSATPDRLEIARCRGHWAQGRVSLSGIHEGQWWQGWEGTSRIAWNFAARAEDFLTTLPAPLEARASTTVLAALSRRPLVSGDLAGSGTLVLGWERAGHPGLPTTKTLAGIVAFRNGRIEHPLLPAPVTGVHGIFALAPQRLEIQSARAEMGGTSATVCAAVEGEPFFWSHPRAECTIQTQIPIIEALRFAPDSVRPRLAAVEPRGHVAATLTLSGPLRRSIRADDIAASGTVLFHNVSFQSPTWALDGTFHDISGRLELTENAVRLTTATGWIGRVPFALEAEAQPQAGRFSARAETTAGFRAIQQVLPRALSRYEVGGTLSARFELDAFGKDLFRQAFQLKDLTSATLLHLPFEWGLRGEVRAHDCQLTLETFPTSLTAINGL
ncbi:MAG: DUF3971 domain-containing protein, partial [Candidatus Sumerlaeia bacterium]|nr:DUF3971 domain-containing protein [Candidatus Sumerlaeia bacterium]